MLRLFFSACRESTTATEHPCPRRSDLLTQTIGVEAVTGADEDPLFAVQHVSDRPIGLVRTYFMVPKHLTFIGAVDDQVLLIVAGDEQISAVVSRLAAVLMEDCSNWDTHASKRACR